MPMARPYNRPSLPQPYALCNQFKLAYWRFDHPAWLLLSPDCLLQPFHSLRCKKPLTGFYTHTLVGTFSTMMNLPSNSIA